MDSLLQRGGHAHPKVRFHQSPAAGECLPPPVRSAPRLHRILGVPGRSIWQERGKGRLRRLQELDPAKGGRHGALQMDPAGTKSQADIRSGDAHFLSDIGGCYAFGRESKKFILFWLTAVVYVYVSVGEYVL